MSIESIKENLIKAVKNTKLKIKDNIRVMYSRRVPPSDEDLEKVFIYVEKYIKYKNELDRYV